MLGLAVVLVAGVMFELTTTSRFSASDAVNWMPVSSAEYVLASSAAIAYTYSLAVAVLVGATAALALATGEVVGFAVGATLAIVALLQGGAIFEMLRALTQRAGSVRGRRAGRAAIVLRAAALLAVILLFQLLFNPVLLEGALRTVGSLAVVAPFVPFLWGTAAVYAAFDGPGWAVLAFAAGELGLLGGLLVVAVRLRDRFWSPTEEEVRLEPHAFGARHPVLGALGLDPTEAAIASKDLRGLVRRRELVPILVMPIVLGVVGLFGLSGPGPAGVDRFANVLWVAWIAGFYALLLSATSIGQERRALQVLYTLPVGPIQLFRAKLAVVLAPAVLFGVAWSGLTGLLGASPPGDVIGAALLALATSLEGSLIGLSFASRYSDFQDRPRPQFLRPGAMIAAMFGGMAIMFATIIPADLAITQSGGGAGAAGGLITAAAVLAGISIAISYLAARTGFRRLLLELPF